MTPPFVRLCVISIAWLACACSSDSGPAAPASTGGSAGASTGGAKNTGGSTSTGGVTGTGGFDPALAANCSIDSAGNDCRLCLAVLCCPSAQSCFDAPGCMTAFTTYQTCIKEPGQVDPAGCLGAFTIYAKADAGAHQDLAACIITNCKTCGGVAEL